VDECKPLLLGAMLTELKAARVELAELKRGVEQCKDVKPAIEQSVWWSPFWWSPTDFLIVILTLKFLGIV